MYKQSLSSLTKRQSRLIAAHTIREFVSHLSHNWHDRKEAVKELLKEHGTRAIDCASDVITSLEGKNIEHLSIGVSQFPEDEMLFFVLTNVIPKDIPFAVRKDNIEWGRRYNIYQKEVDLLVMNDLLIDESAYEMPVDIDTAIFKHTGYYVFVNDEARHLDQRSFNNAADNFRRACNLKLYKYRDGEYKHMLPKIFDYIGDDRYKLERYASGSESRWVVNFEKFISGASPIYVGGSINARLLMRLWSDSVNGRIKLLCKPSDFGVALNQRLPINKVVIGNKFAQKIGHDQDIIKKISLLYKACGKILHKVASMARNGNELGLHFMRALMYEFSPKDGDSIHKMWNFIVKEEDIIDLILEDNLFDLIEGKTPTEEGGKARDKLRLASSF